MNMNSLMTRVTPFFVTVLSGIAASGATTAPAPKPPVSPQTGIVSLGDPIETVERVCGRPLMRSLPPSGSLEQSLLCLGRVAIILDENLKVVGIDRNGIALNRLEFPKPIPQDPSRPISLEVQRLNDLDPVVRKHAHDYLCAVLMFDPELFPTIVEAKRKYEEVPEIFTQLTDVLTYSYRTDDARADEPPLRKAATSPTTLPR
jgi:hypothetical protein